MILLEYFKDNTQLSQIVEKLITKIGEPVTLNSHVVSVGASIGIALYPDDADNSDELLHHADEAIVDATIILAKRLNMTCIAEGVETQINLILDSMALF